MQVQELKEKHTECVGKAASVPPPSECNNEEDKATINRLQKEIDEKQLKFDSSIIQMQEDHAQALMLAKQSVVEVDANGDSAQLAQEAMVVKIKTIMIMKTVK